MLSTFALDSQVIKAGLCTGCGACQGLCPYWDSVRGRTIADYDCVREDGRCQRFCPRMPVDLASLREKAFPGEQIIPGIGPFRALYLVRASDPDIREGAQHGGTVTALTRMALQEGLMDAAVLTRADNTLEPRGVLVTDPDEVLKCRGSSYQIPPALAEMNRALDGNHYHSIGFVGTPCKTLALYRMRYEGFSDRLHHQENIGPIIGLFCGWGLDWDGIEELVKKHSEPSGVTHVDIPPSKYHCLQITSGEEQRSVDLEEVLPIVRPACRYCADMSCEFSDLSVGGARSADGWDVDKKWNQVIVRSSLGEEMIKLARDKGILEFKELPEGALEKLKNASLGKQRTALAHLQEKYGAGNLGYLQPSAGELLS